MKQKITIVLLTAALLLATLSGCGAGGSPGDLPYPDGWTVEAPEETESSDSGSDAAKDTDADKTTEEKDDSSESEGPADSDNKDTEAVTGSGKINFFFDTSYSMSRSPEVIRIHSAASKAGAGKDKTYYVLDSDKKIISTNEQLSLSGQYAYGAVIDVLKDTDVPVDKNGVNVLTTDLQSTTTSGTEIGQWLVQTGALYYSFYVFTMQYDGSVEFQTYTSNTIQEYVSVSGCSFDREFLMIVFGNPNAVMEYDEAFLNKLGDSIDYDVCHVALGEASDSEADSILDLTPAPCFQSNLANITYENTNYCYGIDLLESDVEYSLDNTFIFKKSSHSANEKPEAAKAVFYAVPGEDMTDAAEEIAGKAGSSGDISDLFDIEIRTLEYDSSDKAYIESSVPFTAEIWLADGIPSAPENQDLNSELGGDLIPAGTPAFLISLENTDLPKGLYAADVRLTYEEDTDGETLESFARTHSAGLEDYTRALQTECEPELVNGTPSTSRYTRTASGTSVYSRLLDFERLADELIASGGKAEGKKDIISFRVMINNR